MATNISSLYDMLNTLMTTLFPNKRQLSDSLIIENNDELTIADSYGIYFGPATNTNRLIGCQMSVSRTVVITLTKAIRGTHKDLVKIGEAEKALLEEHWLLINDFYKNFDDGFIGKRSFVNDNGIQRIFGESKAYIQIQSTFEIEYFENLI